LEERPLTDPATHDDLSPEGRRRAALGEAGPIHVARGGLRGDIERRVGRGTRFFVVTRRVVTGTYYDGFIHAGNLAYMAMFALFPFFIVVTAVLSAFGEPSQRDALIHSVLTTVPPVVAKAIEPVARNVVAARSGWLLWVGGIVGLWTVSSLIETIRDVLRRAYGTRATEAFWRYRLISTALIFGAVILLMLSLFAQVAIVGAEEAVDAWFPQLDFIFAELTISRVATMVVLYGSIFLLFITLTPSRYRGKAYPKWPGALLVTVWWVAITLLLPVALRLLFNYDLTYGSLAGVMIALFFFWLVGLGMVLGAELNAALAETPEERDAVGQDDNRAREARVAEMKKQEDSA
jgi:membrane protein